MLLPHLYGSLLPFLISRAELPHHGYRRLPALANGVTMGTQTTKETPKTNLVLGGASAESAKNCSRYL